MVDVHCLAGLVFNLLALRSLLMPCTHARIQPAASTMVVLAGLQFRALGGFLQPLAHQLGWHSSGCCPSGACWVLFGSRVMYPASCMHAHIP